MITDDYILLNDIPSAAQPATCPPSVSNSPPGRSLPARPGTERNFFWHLYLFFSTFVFSCIVTFVLKKNCLTNTLPPREQSESPGPQSPDRYYSKHLDKNTHMIIIFCHHLAWLLIKSSITPKQAFLLFKSQSPSPSPTLRAGLITRLF